MDPDSHKGINSTATLFPTPQAHPQLALCCARATFVTSHVLKTYHMWLEKQSQGAVLSWFISTEALGETKELPPKHITVLLWSILWYMLFPIFKKCHQILLGQIAKGHLLNGSRAKQGRNKAISLLLHPNITLHSAGKNKPTNQTNLPPL